LNLQYLIVFSQMFHTGSRARKSSIFHLKSTGKCSVSSMGKSEVCREYHQSTTNAESICNHLNCKYIFTEFIHPDVDDRICIYWKAVLHTSFQKVI